MDRTESLILRGLLYEEPYVRRVLPFIEIEFFDTSSPEQKAEKVIFERIKKYLGTYNAQPTKEIIIVELQEGGRSQEEIDDIVRYLDKLEIEKDERPNVEWLVAQTEEWCQERAVHNAVVEVFSILSGKSEKPKGVIPKLLQDALGVSFDPQVGHDYLADAEGRYEFYHKKDSRIPFHLDYFNQITKGGVPNKTLNICLAGTNVGKSMFMVDLAAAYLMQGKNVLYITLEMAQERIAERIDANLMDRMMDELPFMSKELYMKLIDRIHKKTTGTLIVKEYPTAMAHVGHFRHLLNELLLKKKFKPDAIFIDYLNICASTRAKASGGMYELVKCIAEELRGLAVEFDCPLWSATQMNRSGYNNSDPDLTNTSESFGLPATADFMFALINSEELSLMNQLMVKILKNRYGAIHIKNKDGKSITKFVVGVDRSKQKLYNVSESAQKDISQDDDINSTGCTDYTPKPKSSGAPGQTSDEPDDTPPWEGASTFDIDRPTAQYDPAGDAAERRRISAKFGSTPYKPGYSVFSGKKRNEVKG